MEEYQSVIYSCCNRYNVVPHCALYTLSNNGSLRLRLTINHNSPIIDYYITHKLLSMSLADASLNFESIDVVSYQGLVVNFMINIQN